MRGIVGRRKSRSRRFCLRFSEGHQIGTLGSRDLISFLKDHHWYGFHTEYLLTPLYALKCPFFSAEVWRWLRPTPDHPSDFQIMTWIGLRHFLSYWLLQIVYHDSGIIWARQITKIIHQISKYPEIFKFKDIFSFFASTLVQFNLFWTYSGTHSQIFKHTLIKHADLQINLEAKSKPGGQNGFHPFFSDAHSPTNLHDCMHLILYWIVSIRCNQNLNKV